MLDQDLATLIRPPFDVVANIPYHITSPILHRILALKQPPERVVLMVQREVAERVAAAPGKMSYLSVFAQYHAAVRVLRTVPREAFEPAPDVESAVLLLEPRTEATASARGGRRALAARAGGVPRAPQDAPQRARAPAAPARVARDGRARSGRDRIGPPAPDRVRGGMAAAASRDPAAARAAVTAADPLRRLTPVVRVAPAKLNLTLAVLGRRADGFHDLHSVMAPLALADLISLVPTSSGPDRLHVVGADLAAGPENLVLRAVAALRARLGRLGETLPPLSIRLDKRIPVAAGLGGGSSDAAAAIDAALEAWAVDLEAGARTRTAAAVGSDVPFFFAGTPALVTGRGESVTPLRAPSGPPLGILLVTPAIAVSTAAVYGAFAGGSGSTRLTSEHLGQELRTGLTSKALLDRAGILAVANDLASGTALIGARDSPVPAPADARPWTPGRTVGLGPDPLGPLSFARGRARGGRSGRSSR